MTINSIKVIINNILLALLITFLIACNRGNSSSDDELSTVDTNLQNRSTIPNKTYTPNEIKSETDKLHDKYKNQSTILDKGNQDIYHIENIMKQKYKDGKKYKSYIENYNKNEEKYLHYYSLPGVLLEEAILDKSSIDRKQNIDLLLLDPRIYDKKTGSLSSIIDACLRKKDFRTLSKILDKSPNLKYRILWSACNMGRKFTENDYIKVMDLIFSKYPNLSMPLSSIQEIARKGYLKALKKYINKFPNAINEYLSWGRNEYKTGIMEAALNSGNLELVNYLITKGAKFDTSRRKINLGNAASAGNVEVLKIAINNLGGDKYLKDYSSSYYNILNSAVRSKKVEMVKFLIEKKGLNIKKHEDKGLLVLDQASYNKNPDIAEYLIYKGANINSKDKDGNTPMHNAIEYNNVKIVELFLKKNADISIKNNKNLNPLEFAKKELETNKNMINVLYKERNKESKVPEFILEKSKNLKEIIKLLEKASNQN